MKQCYLRGTQTLATICFTCILPSLSLNRREMKGRLWWIRNWLECCNQKVNGQWSYIQEDAGKECVPQGPNLDLLHFNIISNETDDRIKCILCKFADDTEMTGAVDT